MEAINCPICNSTNIEEVLKLNCGVYDKSKLYRYVVVGACNTCGHLYNRLSAEDVQGLYQYYREEYAPINMSAAYKTGNMPGGEGTAANERYSNLFNFLSPHIHLQTRILDVGCAIGGFLDYLNDQGFENFAGIDLVDKFVKKVQQKGYTAKLGSAEAIPFGSHSFDALIVNQVIEHLIAPRKVFKEARRVLGEGGILYLGIPDASRYEDICSFDFYGLLIRDHIQHFYLEHIKLMAMSEGFELLDTECNDHLVISPELFLPNINVIFRRTDQHSTLNITEKSFHLRHQFETYVKESLAGQKQKNLLISELIESQNPLYAWGIGNEFLYLYENTGLKQCNISGLIDVNSYKQKNLMVKGFPIASPQILSKADRQSKIIITAIAYQKAISRSLEDLHYAGSIIYL